MLGAYCLEVAPSLLRDISQGARERIDLLEIVIPLATSAVKRFPGSFCFALTYLHCHFHKACMEGHLLAFAIYLRHRVTHCRQLALSNETSSPCQRVAQIV